MIDTSDIEYNDAVDDILTKILIPIWDGLRENDRRHIAASIAIVLGYGGVTRASKITGLSRVTVTNGKNELEKDIDVRPDETNARTQRQRQKENIRIRKEGGGRKSTLSKSPGLLGQVDGIVKGNTFGDPERVIFYTTMGLDKIAAECEALYNTRVSRNIVSDALRQLGYSKQLNQKMLQTGQPHPSRNEQFEFINAECSSFLSQDLPVISVDTKKKENIGNFKNNGAEYREKKNPRRVLDHDFPLKELGKIAPYGIYVQNNNTAFVNVGISSDTAEFAVQSIRLWIELMGKENFPDAKKILVTCDGGGSNGYRNRLWKAELQTLADETGWEFHICHFPPGTSKWNKIEHRLFCYISRNWAGVPLVGIDTVINYIGSTTTAAGLTVKCQVDKTIYEKGIKVGDEELMLLNIEHCGPVKEWNYIIRPRQG